MSQDYKVIDDEQTLKDSLPDLNANFATIASNFSGTDFPTNNLVEGMTCYRTDEQKVYRYRSTGEDTFDWKLVEDLNKNFATVATSGKYDDLTNKPEIATQAEAEAGTDNDKIMTPLRTKQAIDVNAKAISSTFNLTSSGWSSGSRTLTSSNLGFAFTATDLITMLPTTTTTAEQYDMIAKAKIISTAQSTNSLTLKCLGNVPTANITVTFVKQGGI